LLFIKLEANIQLKAEIITIGDEILIGQIIDTNSAWIAKKLNQEGIAIKNIQSIADEESAIFSALDLAFERSDLILMTGGLGPTQDDITKQTLAKYFNCDFKESAEVLAHLKAIFELRNKNLLEINKMQAMLPEACEVLFNKLGTAPGMLFQKNGKWLVSMPGVPYEMQYIIEEVLLPKIQSHFNLGKLYHHTITTIDIPESLLAVKLNDILCTLPAEIKPAYLPNLNIVRLRLSAAENGSLKIIMDEKMAQIIAHLGPKIVLSNSGQSPSEHVFEMLKQHKLTITMAESCSGGFVAHQIIAFPGASAVFKGSIVAYDYDIKTTELNVPKVILEASGAVSEETVYMMCKNVRVKFKSDIGVAISGIAGPDGGMPDKPVGTVYIGVANEKKVIVKKYQFFGDRLKIVERSSNTAYNMVRMLILDLI